MHTILQNLSISVEYSSKTVKHLYILPLEKGKPKCNIHKTIHDHQSIHLHNPPWE